MPRLILALALGFLVLGTAAYADEAGGEGYATTGDWREIPIRPGGAMAAAAATPTVPDR